MGYKLNTGLTKTSDTCKKNDKNSQITRGMQKNARKVAFYIGSLHKGGAERVFVNLAEYFLNQDYQVLMVTQYQYRKEEITPDANGNNILANIFISLFGYSSFASPTTETTGLVLVNIVVTIVMKLFLPTQDKTKSGFSSFQMRCNFRTLRKKFTILLFVVS